MDEPLESDSRASSAAASDSLLRSAPQSSTMEDYLRAVERRRNLFRPSQEALTTQQGYSINPVGAAPHGAQIHTMDLSHDSSILLTGGSDGYVRWYDLFARTCLLKIFAIRLWKVYLKAACLPLGGAIRIPKQRRKILLLARHPTTQCTVLLVRKTRFGV